MVTHDLTIVDYTKPRDEKGTSFEGYRVEINAYWVTIRRGPYEKDKGRIVYQRTPNSTIPEGDDGWLDESHKRITDAISALDKALTAVLPK